MNDKTFFNKLMKNIALSINTCLPCKVISYDKSKREAKVQPLYKVKNEGKAPEVLPPIEDVPVLYHQFEVDGVTKTYTPVLHPGQVVQVAVNQRMIDDVLNGDIAYPDSSKPFRLRDSVVIGVIR